MQQDIPAPIQAYFDASNAHDLDATVACFAADATVLDDGETMTGIEAIRAWKDRVSRKYRVTSTVKQATRDGDAHVITASVAGSFEGSPIDLAYRFTFAGQQITSLVIDRGALVP